MNLGIVCCLCAMFSIVSSFKDLLPFVDVIVYKVWVKGSFTIC